MNFKHKEYLIPLGIFLTVFLYSSFFLQGIRLFDDDYNVCLVNTHKYSLATVLWQILDPVLTDWNAEFRPVQTLIFKALHSLFEFEPSGYYYFKSLMHALFSTVYYLFLRRNLNIAAVAFFSTLFLATASSTFRSLLWVSDLVIVSEFLALLVYAIFLYLESLEKPSKVRLLGCLVLMFFLTLICDRTRASAKLIPGILFFYIVLFDWRKFKRYGLTIVSMVAVLLPWQVIISNPAPFLSAKPGTVKAHVWQPATTAKFWKLFGRDFEPFSLIYTGYAPISVLAIIGFVLLYTFILATIVLIARRSPLRRTDKFLIVWAGVNIVSLMSYPSLPDHFQARYAISVLIPLIPLILLTISRAAQLTFKRRWVPAFLVAALVITQVCFHGYHTFRGRNDSPSFMIAADNLRCYIADNIKNSYIFYQYFPISGFRPTDDGNQFFDNNTSAFSRLAYNSLVSHSPLYIASPFEFSHPTVKLERSFPGRSDSLYDRIFNDREPHHYKSTLYLYKYLPTPQPADGLK